MDFKGASDEELLAECVARKLMSSTSAIRILKLSSRDLKTEADLWIMSNFELFEGMEKEALSMAKKGRKFGAKLLAERARWSLEKGTGNGFKINNYLIPYIARRMVERHPKLAPFIKMRKVHHGMASASGGNPGSAPDSGR